jgi:hypothetical protein
MDSAEAMTDHEFEDLRRSAFAIAYRTLGSVSEAEDVVGAPALSPGAQPRRQAVATVKGLVMAAPRLPRTLVSSSEGSRRGVV